MPVINKTNSCIIGGLENFFSWWGRFVSLHPYPVILTSMLITVISSIGFLHFRMEHRANYLWIPADSDYNIRQEWIDENFKSQVRYENILFQSENVLSPDSIKEMYKINKRISNMEVEGRRFEDICAKIPIADIFQSNKRRKREVKSFDTNSNDDNEFVETTDNLTEEEYDNDYDNFWAEEYALYDAYDEADIPEIRINYLKYGSQKENNDTEDTLESLPDSIYCDLVETLNEKCQQLSLLEIWRFKEHLIESVTQQEILDAVNILNKSPWFGYGANYSGTLGGITYNSSGHVVGAKTAQIVWVLEVPEDAEIANSQANALELEAADQISLDWEDKFIQTVLNMSSELTASLLPNAVKSFGDVSTQAIFFDAFFMAGGYLIMFIYTILMLGRLNTLELRLFLTISGLASIGMGIVLSVGLSSLLGFPYTPMHAVLPFICLGIGIDDMFIISQCWSNLERNEDYSQLSTADKMSLTMRHAGVAVTVTSLTDVFAFGVGAVTKMPGLQSFCVCTAIALGSIYLLQVSWFAAWMVLDEKRIQSGRDGLFPCIVHENFTPSECSRSNCSSVFQNIYSHLLSSRFYHLLVIILTLAFLTFGIMGTASIRQIFKPWLLLPAETYMRKWLDVSAEFYPDFGFGTSIYTGSINHTHLANLELLSQSFQGLKEENIHIIDFTDWWSDLKEHAYQKSNYSTWTEFADEKLFPEIFSDFLFSATGTIYQSNFKLDGELVCNEPAPSILTAKFWFTYKQFDGPEQHIPAKRKVEALISASGLPDAFSFSTIYAAWETDEIIGFELLRNIGLAMACVFVVTFLLLANLPICLMVLTTVVLTLLDIIGFLHFWDITIDIISCVNIVLAIGLCVDYSVHVGHAYLVATGSRSEKAQEAINTIGPAVFNGGFTTFLALVLLGASSSHVFISFFKVFSLTVIFGLFHGLVLFPILLSTIGPEDTAEDTPDNSNEPPDQSPLATVGISMVGTASQVQHINDGLVNQTFVPDNGHKPDISDQPWLQKHSPRSGRHS